ncbi:hypothetical protein SBA1_190004 [Candidatus Sulfotelmatobacter kueseliae]|uniref:Uncharacterized protein n=1 Tax=Candidatus Sulfotelmatobacter kueseliae TaxID=2042962 RepID=A0A2U3KDX0_9BACT|nr:hypothetical protein SBA1_190004 [Candidatus Sulfotelmatobacter kueseliae]
MQPGRERRFAAEGRDLAVELQESFLCQILGLGDVRSHAQTQRVDTAFVLIVESLEGFRIPLLGSLDGIGFVKLVALSLSFLWLSVGQVAFSGRTPTDAANYLYVVWLAGRGIGTKVISPFTISEPFYRSWDSPSCRCAAGNPLPTQG